MDVNSGDGRIVSFRTGEKYINRTRQHWWGPLCKQFNQPDFLAALYDDLNSIDLTKYDFKKERIKILTESYKRLVEANIPFVARSLVDYLRNILSGSGEKRIDKHVYLKMKRRDMYLAFQEYAKAEGIDKPVSAQSYYTQIKSLKLKIDDITVNNNRGMGFVPNKLYQECLQRRYEHSDFALEGFRKEEEPIDNTAFKLELPKEEK